MINKSHLKRKIKRIPLKLSDSLSTSQLIHLIEKLVMRRVNKLYPAEALRFLFSLEHLFYRVQGRQAIAYDGGMHTKHRHIRYHDFFSKHIHKDETALDLGCGTGSVAYHVAKETQANVVGIDKNPYHLSIAIERHAHPKVQYIFGDILQIQPNGRFDVIILSNILEHIVQRVEFLTTLQRVIIPKRFLIRVPLFERDWRVPLKKELGVEWRLDLDHKTEYTLESFAEEMRQANLKITYQEVRWSEIWAEVSNS
ncbi:MAG: hypothetical protein B6242_07250 [Anaerolineaceae bacterium 4572_78]|nr:MAG: hypothetical protein B6242_07250 [Anaerolineaceae bacterium 4572_78]